MSLKSHLNIRFLHTSIIHTNISHPKEYNILFLASFIFSLSHQADIIFIHCKIITKIASPTIRNCRNATKFHTTDQNSQEFIKIFLSYILVHHQISDVTSSNVFFHVKAKYKLPGIFINISHNTAIRIDLLALDNCSSLLHIDNIIIAQA